MYEEIVPDIVDFICEDGQVYFIAMNIPAIWQYDYARRNVSILTYFPESIAIAGAFVRLIKVGQKIYCIPCFADDIYCYNMETSLFYSINIPKDFFCRMPKRKIIEPVNSNETLWCVSRSPHLIIEINTESDTYEIHEFQEMVLIHNYFAVRLEKGVIEYPFMQNRIICFDTSKKEFHIRTLYETDEEDYLEEKNIYNFTYDNNGGIWWCNFRGDVYRIEGDRICSIKMPDCFIGQYQDVIGRNRPGINGMILMNDHICFVLASEYKILKYNIIEKKFMWSENPGDECFRKQEVYFHYNKLNERVLVLYSNDSRFFYIWDIERGFIDKFCIELAVQLLAQNRGLQQYYNVTDESHNFNLQIYLNFVNYIDGEMQKKNKK